MASMQVEIRMIFDRFLIETPDCACPRTIILEYREYGNTTKQMYKTFSKLSRIAIIYIFESKTLPAGHYIYIFHMLYINITIILLLLYYYAFQISFTVS